MARDGHSTAAGVVAPLWAVLAFTFVNSFASGITFNGIFFITKNVFGFSQVTNCLLGLVLGVTYIAGAMAAGPIMRRVHASGSGLSERGVLTLLMLAAVGINAIPIGAWMLAGDAPMRSAWAVWVYLAMYSALTGVLWPIVESYLSGGRAGGGLRRAMGIWNCTWSSALILALGCIGPLGDPARLGLPGFVAGFGALSALMLASLLHAGALLVLPALPRHPGEHGHEAGGVGGRAVPESYARLLRVHRILLPVVYFVMYALGPLLPGLAEKALEWTGDRKQIEIFAPILTSVWLAARVGGFVVMGLWQSWHGRWTTAIAGPSLLLGGFGFMVLSPIWTDGMVLFWLTLAGLIQFGVGSAMVYCAALYYVLEVGSAQVEAGGSHEALIGVGYTLGPMCTLGPSVLAQMGVVTMATANAQVLALVGVATLGGLGLAMWQGRPTRGGRVERG